MAQVKVNNEKGIEVRPGRGLVVDPQAANAGVMPYKACASGSVGSSAVASTDPPGWYLLNAFVIGVTATLPNPGEVPMAMWTLTNNGANGNFFVTSSNRAATGQFPFGANQLATPIHPLGSTRNDGNNMTVTGSITLMSDGLRYVPLMVSGSYTFGL